MMNFKRILHQNKRALIIAGAIAGFLLWLFISLHELNEYTAEKSIEEWVERQDPATMPATASDRLVINDNYICDTVKLKTGNGFRCYRKNSSGQFVLETEF
jgi:hypothetical protein